MHCFVEFLEYSFCDCVIIFLWLLLITFLNSCLKVFISLQSNFVKVFNLDFAILWTFVQVNTFVLNLELIRGYCYEPKWLIFILSPVEISLRWSQIWDAKIIGVSSWKSQSELMNFIALFGRKRLTVSRWEEPFSIFFAAHSISVLQFLKFFIFENTWVGVEMFMAIKKCIKA